MSQASGHCLQLQHQQGWVGVGGWSQWFVKGGRLTETFELFLVFKNSMTCFNDTVLYGGNCIAN